MSQSESTPLSRRRLFVGAGTAGARAAAAAVLPLQPQPTATAAAVLPKPLPEAGGGYQLSAHVQRYYQTAKV
jgi:hypothetical protein